MRRLREDLAAAVGHDADGTWVAGGSNEILTQLLTAYGGPGRSAVRTYGTIWKSALKKQCWVASGRFQLQN